MGVIYLAKAKDTQRINVLQDVSPVTLGEVAQYCLTLVNIALDISRHICQVKIRFDMSPIHVTRLFSNVSLALRITCLTETSSPLYYRKIIPVYVCILNYDLQPVCQEWRL